MSMNWSDSLGVTHDIVLENNNYSIFSLIRSIQNEMNSAKTNGAVNYLVRQNGVDRLTISTYLGITAFDLNFSVSPDTNMAKILGFGTTNYGGTTSYTSPNPIDLVYTKNIFIGSTYLGQNAFDSSEVSNGASNVIAKVELDVDFGEIKYCKHTDLLIRNTISNLSTIDIRLLDDRGNDAQLPNNDFKISFDIYSRVFDNSYSI